MNLSHDPADDTAARAVIDTQLHRPDERVWAELMSDTYALQTHRVLCTVEDQTVSSHTHRAEDVAADRQRFLAGDIPADQWERMADEYSAWRKRAAHFLTVVRQRKRYAADRANALRGYDQAAETRAMLRILAEAVAGHRAATEAEGIEPESHDRMLWLRLDTLRVEVVEGINGRTTLSLREWLAPKKSARRSHSVGTDRKRRTGREAPKVPGASGRI